MRVLIYSSIQGLHHEILKRIRCNAKLCSLLQVASFELHDAEQYNAKCSYDIVVGDPTMVCDLLNQDLPNLKWFQSTFAGVNAILQNSTRDDYILTRVGSGFGSQMVEYVFGWMLADCIRIDDIRSDQTTRQWQSSSYRNKPGLANKSIAILGAGSIGMELAHAAHTMRMFPTLLCTPSTLQRKREQYPHLSFTTCLHDAITNSHYIVNTLPSTPATKYLISSDILSRCLYAPVLINIGRGDIISESEVISSLSSRYISRAILDVFEVEPLPPSSPLWTHPRVTITPHISALSTPSIVADVFVNNLAKYADGVELDFVVDRSKGY